MGPVLFLLEIPDQGPVAVLVGLRGPLAEILG